MTSLDTFLAAISIHPYLIYGFMAIFSSIEGPILSLLSGIVLHTGYLHFVPVYIALIIGDLLGDTLWYWLGYHFGEPFVDRFGRYLSINKREINIVKRIFHRYTNWILIISKITMGFGFAVVTLFTAGMIRIPYRHYIFLNILGQFVWTGFLLFVGYKFGEYYLAVDNVLGRVTMIGLLLVAVGGLFGYGRFLKNKITKHYGS